ncbi:MAG: hypothetical protein WD940_01770 [Patescibacteria group bacterium]
MIPQTPVLNWRNGKGEEMRNAFAILILIVMFVVLTIWDLLRNLYLIFVFGIETALYWIRHRVERKLKRSD